MDLEEYYDDIYRYCFFRMRDRSLAEDLTQETFLRFLETSAYHDRGKPLAFLYTIARNLCIDHIRRTKARPGSGINCDRSISGDAVHSTEGTVFSPHCIRLGAHGHIDCSGRGSTDAQRIRPGDDLPALCAGIKSR